MDSTDYRLLNLLQRNAELTNEKLGKRIGASPSAVNRRIKKLRSKGVIQAVAALVDQNAVGRPLTFIVALEIERKDAALYDRLKKWLLAEDAIQQAYNVTGSGDFIIVVTSTSVEQYDALMNELVSANPNVRKYVTNLVLRSFKKGLFVPAGA